MNERIKQLAKEAGYYLYDLTETHECKTVETDSKDEWITLEKFAELIVKDIAKTVFKHLYNQDTVAEYNEYGWDCLPGDLRTMIEKHFGVEA